MTRLLLGVVGAAGYLVPGSPGSILRGRVEATGRQAQINTFGGGVNEVQREIVATAGLGMTPGIAVSGRERFEELARFPDHSAELAALIGQSSGAPNLSPDAVNVPMIRHWVEAMGDHNAVYVSDVAAPRRRLRPALRAAHHAAGLDHARPARLAGRRRGPDRRGRAGERAQRPDDGSAGRRGSDLGGGHELRTALRPPAGGGRPAAGAFRDRVDLGPEADRARHRALPDDAWTTWPCPTSTCRRRKTSHPSSKRRCSRRASTSPPCAFASSSTCRRTAHRLGPRDHGRRSRRTTRSGSKVHRRIAC